VLTFDEHGGFFDRMSPPRAVHPARGAAFRRPQTTTRRFLAWFVEQRNAPFDFKRLGMRVPTIIVSPLIDSRRVDDEFDHTSVIATLRDLFAPHQLPLTQRDRLARPFWDLVLGTPHPNPPDIDDPDYPPEDGAPVADAVAMAVAPESARPVGRDAPAYVTGGDLVAQLEHLPPALDKLLTERGAPSPPDQDALDVQVDGLGASATDQIAARVASWQPGDDERGTARPAEA